VEAFLLILPEIHAIRRESAEEEPAHLQAAA
jgi:hypothetical protein